MIQSRERRVLSSVSNFGVANIAYHRGRPEPDSQKWGFGVPAAKGPGEGETSLMPAQIGEWPYRHREAGRTPPHGNRDGDAKSRKMPPLVETGPGE